MRAMGNTTPIQAMMIARKALALSVALVACTGAMAQAQARVTQQAKDLETRAALEQEAQAAEQNHRTGEAFLLRNRLQHGDFQDGDRIIVQLLGSVPYNDTITVRAGKMLP